MGVTYDVLCSGPGPHIPVSGIVGTSSIKNANLGMLCPSPACQAAGIAADAVEQVDLANATTLQQRAAAALQANAIFLAIASPTTAQAVTQVKALTRQIDAIVRLLVTQDTSTISDS